MTEGLPRHNLSAESLRNMSAVSTHNKSEAPLTTHFSDPLELIACVYPQDLGCDLPTIILTFPHVRKSTVAHRVVCWVVAKRNLQ